MSRTGIVALALFVAVVVAAAVAAVVTATRDEPGTPGELSGEVTVSAAASLTDAFEELAATFEAQHPGVDVALNLGGSATLAAQVREGVPADVLAAADPAVVAPLVAAGAVDGEPTVFATNELRIVVPAGNPGGIAGLADLTDDDLFVGICVAGQPCGDYARTALAAAGLDPSAVADTEEADVRAVLSKVVSGELDAGIVYATDVLAAGGAVEGIPVPGSAAYPIVLLWDAPNPAAATAFLDLVRSPAGQAVLRRNGFGPPP